MVRSVTGQGISGYGHAETRKVYLRPMVMFYKDYILGEDPTDIERVMMKIRRLGAFKPWGAAISAIESAPRDMAGSSGVSARRNHSRHQFQLETVAQPDQYRRNVWLSRHPSAPRFLGSSHFWRVTQPQISPPLASGQSWSWDQHFDPHNRSMDPVWADRV